MSLRRRVAGEAGAVLAAGALVVVAVKAFPDEAPSQRSEGAIGVDALVAGSCPEPKRVAREDVPERQLTRARRGLFSVFTERVRLVPPVDWSADPIGAHRFRQNLHKLRYLEPLLSAYRSRRDAAALRQAVELTLDWTRANEPGDEGTPTIAWVDKVVADRVPVLAFSTRAAACEGLLDRTEVRELLSALRAHGAFLSREANHEPSNHGLFVDIGLFLLADYLPFLSAAESWKRLAVDRFRSTLEDRTADGIWLEHSSHYQFLVLGALEDMAGYADAPELDRLVDEMRDSAPWLVMPDSGLAQFGSSELGPVPDWASEDAGELEGTRAFPAAGMAMVRSRDEPDGDSYLAITAGFHNLVHKQADDLSFELYEAGHRVVADTGMYHKDPGPEREFMVAARAHSVLVVDGESFPIADESAPYGSGIVAAGEGEGWYAIVARNPLLDRRGVRHRRLFLYRPGEALVIVDRVRAREPHVYSRFFQLGPDLEIEPAGPRSLDLRADGLRAELYDARVGAPTDRIQVRGRDDPLEGWTSPAFRELVPRWSVRLDSRATDVTHVATLALDPAAPRARGVEWEREAARIELAGDAPVEVRLGDDGLSVVR